MLLGMLYGLIIERYFPKNSKDLERKIIDGR